MPPTLLIFIEGPGGSRLLEGGWQAWPRTLCPSGAVFFSHSSPIQHLGQRPRGLWMWENSVGIEEWKKPCAQRTHWCQGIPLPTSRDLCLERSMTFAGRDSVC